MAFAVYMEREDGTGGLKPYNAVRSTFEEAVSDLIENVCCWRGMLGKPSIYGGVTKTAPVFRIIEGTPDELNLPIWRAA